MNYKGFSNQSLRIPALMEQYEERTQFYVNAIAEELLSPIHATKVALLLFFEQQEIPLTPTYIREFIVAWLHNYPHILIDNESITTKFPDLLLIMHEWGVFYRPFRHGRASFYWLTNVGWRIAKTLERHFTFTDSSMEKSSKSSTQAWIQWGILFPEIRKRLRQGESISSIAQRLDIKRGTLYYFVQRHPELQDYAPKKMRIIIDWNTKLPLLLEDFHAGMSISDMAKKYDIKKKTLMAKLYSLGMRVRRVSVDSYGPA